MAELQREGEAQETIADVVKTLTDARLLVTDTDQQVDVAHEALIRGWPRMQAWINEDREALRMHRRITEAAREWERLQHDEGVLIRGALLLRAQEWQAVHGEDMNALERNFLAASIA